MSRRMPIPSSPGDWAALHVAVVIPSFGLDRRELGHPRVVGSEVAHRIGCARIARERKGLAAAAAEIELTTWAACAWLPHPSCTAEGTESRGVCPDIRERSLAHVPELEPGNRLRGMAGQHLACGCYVERAATPAADARFWISRVVVRHHGIDDDPALMPRTQLRHGARRARDLLPGGWRSS